jgi:hypothetical protein
VITGERPGPFDARYRYQTVSARALAAGDWIGAWQVARVEHGNRPGSTRVIFKSGARVILGPGYTIEVSRGRVTDEDLAPLRAIWGKQLHVGEDEPDSLQSWSARKHVAALARVPEGHQAFLKRQRVLVHIGRSPVVAYDDFGYLRGQPVREGASGGSAGYTECTGMIEYPSYHFPPASTVTGNVTVVHHNPPKHFPAQIVLGGPGHDGSVLAAAHEVGHGLDYFLGDRGRLSDQPEFRAIYKLAMSNRNVAFNPYYTKRPSESSDMTARHEFFAETYAAWVATRTGGAGIASGVYAGSMPRPGRDPGRAYEIEKSVGELGLAMSPFGQQLIDFYDGLDARIAAKGTRPRRQQ